MFKLPGIYKGSTTTKFITQVENTLYLFKAAIIIYILRDNQRRVLPKIVMNKKKNNVKSLAIINTNTELSYGLIKKKRKHTIV